MIVESSDSVILKHIVDKLDQTQQHEQSRHDQDQYQKPGKSERKQQDSNKTRHTIFNEELNFYVPAVIQLDGRLAYWAAHWLGGMIASPKDTLWIVPLVWFS